MTDVIRGWACSDFVIIVCSCLVSAVRPRQSRSRLSNPDDSQFYLQLKMFSGVGEPLVGAQPSRRDVTAGTRLRLRLLFSSAFHPPLSSNASSQCRKMTPSAN